MEPPSPRGRTQALYPSTGGCTAAPSEQHRSRCRTSKSPAWCATLHHGPRLADKDTMRLEFSGPLSSKILAFFNRAPEKWCQRLQTHRELSTVVHVILTRASVPCQLPHQKVLGFIPTPSGSQLWVEGVIRKVLSVRGSDSEFLADFTTVEVDWPRAVQSFSCRPVSFVHDH